MTDRQLAILGVVTVALLAVTILTSIAPSQIAAVLGTRQTLEQVVVERALMARDAGCAGVVCSGREAAAVREAVDIVDTVDTGSGSRFLVVTPGVRPAGAEREDDQQRVVTPRAAIEAGADLIVVGRPIREAADPAARARAIVAEIGSALAG